MVYFKKKQRTFQPRMIFEKIYRVLNTDSYSLTSVSVLLFPEGHQHPFSIFRTRFQNVVFNPFIDFLLSLVGLGLQSGPQIIFFLDFLYSQTAVDLVFVFISKRLYLCVWLKIEFLSNLNSIVLVCKIAQLVSEFWVFLIFQAGNVVHVFQGRFKKLVKFGSQVFAYIFGFTFFTMQIFPRINILFEDFTLQISEIFPLPNVTLLLVLFPLSPFFHLSLLLVLSLQLLLSLQFLLALCLFLIFSLSLFGLLCKLLLRLLLRLRLNWRLFLLALVQRLGRGLWRPSLFGDLNLFNTTCCLLCLQNPLLFPNSQIFFLFCLFSPLVYEMLVELRATFEEIEEQQHVELRYSCVMGLVCQNDLGDEHQQETIDIEIFVDQFFVIREGNQIKVSISKAIVAIHEYIEQVPLPLAQGVDHRF